METIGTVNPAAAKDSPGLPLRVLFQLPRILVAALLCFLCAASFAQPPGPNYTADMPSVDRVKAEIKGSDLTDTLARQIAVFTYLSAYIQRIKYNRTVTGPYTPEEQRVMGSYDLARYQISQDYAKSHTPAEIEAFGHLEGKYEFDTAFNCGFSPNRSRILL